MGKDKKNQELDVQIEKVYAETPDGSAPAPTTEKERVKQEKKEWKFKRKVKRGFKALRLRKLKNFFLWFAGVLSGLAILAAGIFIAVGVVPVKNLIGKDSEEVVSEDLGNMSALGIFLSINDYIKDYSSVKEAFPIVDKAINDLLADYSEYVEVDFDAVKDIPFDSEEFPEKLFGGVRVVASIDSLKINLGDFSDLPIFINDPVLNGDGEQQTIATIDDTADGFQYKLYNYYDSANDKYLSASNKEGTGWADGLSESTALFYASLASMPFSDLAGVIEERMGVVKVKDLINTFSPGASTGIIGDILGDVDIANMGTFTIDNVKLSAFIDRYEKDSTQETEVYGLLRSILGVEGDEEILISHLTKGEFDFDNVEISRFIEEDTEVYDLLRKIFNVPTGPILVSHLSGEINFDNVEISEFISESSPLYRLLRKVFNVPTGPILVSHLSGTVNFDNVEVSEFVTRWTDGFKLNETEEYKMLRKLTGVQSGEILVKDLTASLDGGIKLSSFMDRYKENSTEETTIYKILRMAFKVPSGQDITVNDIGGTFNVNLIDLSVVLDETGNKKLFEIIRSSTGKGASDPVTIGDLERFDINKLQLDLVINKYESDGKTETKIWNILSQAVTGSGDGGAILVGDLSTFNINGLKLDSVINKYESDGTTETKIWNILSQAVTGTGDDGAILVGDLSTFNINGLKLDSVINKYESDGTTETKIWNILSQAVTGTGDDGAILVGDLSTFNINDLKLDSVINKYESDGETETKLWKILSQAINAGADGIITVGELSGSFDINKVELSLVIDKYESDGETKTKLWKILEETVVGTGPDGTYIVDDLDTFNISGLSLATVITEEQKEESKVLKALLNHGDVTVGNIDKMIDELDISEVFGNDCFTTDVSKAVTFSDPMMGRYKKVINPNEDCETCEEGKCNCETFVLIGKTEVYNGEIYYVSKDAQMWLFLYFDDAYGDGDGTSVTITDFDEDGFALKYKPMHVTFGSFDSKVERMSEEIKHASVRQLVQVGFIEENPAYEKTTIAGMEIYTYKKTLSEAIGQ